VDRVEVVETIDRTSAAQVLHIQHKTLSASTARRDLVVVRAVSESAARNIAYYTSSPSNDAKVGHGQFTRADMIFQGIAVEPVDAASCKVSLVHFCGLGPWIHAKFYTTDIERCALRVSKVNTQFFPVY